MDGAHVVEQLKLGRTSTVGTSKHRDAKDGLRTKRKGTSRTVTFRVRCLHLSLSLSASWWKACESPRAPRVTWKLLGTSRTTCRPGVTAGEEGSNAIES